MTSTAPPEPEPAILESNLAALAAFCPRAAEQLRVAEPPADARPIVGRDGTLTYAWNDESGRLCWLGRATMPDVRARALIDAFQHGSRNVLLHGFGQGAEIKLLLQRLAGYQAVFAVDQTAWAAALVLRLHEFAEDLRRGRLLIFTGSTAWDDLQDFLVEHDGFLTPERVLAWPWFDAAAVADVSDRLAAVGAAVSRHRAARITEMRQERTAVARSPLAGPAAPALAVFSNIPDARVLRAAADLQAGADHLGVPCHPFVLDGPTMVHPHALEVALWRLRPTIIVFLDLSPGALSFEPPPAAWFVLRTQALPVSADWLQQLPSAVRLGVARQALRDQAVAAGLDASRVLVFPPAAAPGLGISPGPRGSPILVLADGHDVSAEAVGLHLASHRRLWEEAEEIIRRKCDTYDDDQAGSVFESAERRLGMRVDSPSVRDGLVSRIRQVLGPVLVRRAYCLALIEAGLNLDLYGGWTHDPILAKYDRGAWPGPKAAAAALSGHGAVVSLETTGYPSAALLDGLGAGLIGLIRTHPADETADGLASVLDPASQVWRFDSRGSLARLIKAVQSTPQEFMPRAAAARAQVNQHHTWACRVSAIIQACQSS